MARIRVWVSTNKVGSKCETEVDLGEYFDESETISAEQREKMIEEVAREAMFQMIEWSYEIED